MLGRASREAQQDGPEEGGREVRRKEGGMQKEVSVEGNGRRKRGRQGQGKQLNMTSPTAIQFLDSTTTYGTYWLAVAPLFQLGYTNGLLGTEQTRICNRSTSDDRMESKCASTG